MVQARAGADHGGMVRSTSLIALAGLACAFAAGCGDDAAPVAAVAKPKPPAKVSNLERFLMRNDEEPGFKLIASPQSASGAESAGLPAEGQEQLRRNGYISQTWQPIESDDTAGMINVALFKTEAGAREQLKWETSDAGIHSQIPDTKIRSFTVRGVPGALGWTGRDVHGNRIGHVFWVQGRCMFILGNEGSGPFVEGLSAGAKAIYRRTNGECPCY